MKKNFLLIFFTISISLSLLSQSNNFNKYSIKLSASTYKGFLYTLPYVSLDLDVDLIRIRHFNANFHFTYRISNISEVGVYMGFVKYNYVKLFDNLYFDFLEDYAPIFGLNYNFQILPLFSIYTKKYNLYLSMRYGLVFLPKLGEDYAWEVLMYNDPLKNRCRQEYGFGIGGSILFYNHIGFFIENYLGNFSIYPDLVSSFSNSKIGIQFSW